MVITVSQSDVFKSLLLFKKNSYSFANINDKERRTFLLEPANILTYLLEK